MNEKTKLGAYFHLPFCDTKCVYCDFYSITNPYLTSDFYTALEKEIRLSAAHHHLKGQKVTSIFFGGGTPSLASPDDIKKYIKTIDHCFALDPDAEITLESNPGTLTKENLMGFQNAGVNRLSIGVQSFLDKDLKALSRIHSSQQAIQNIQLSHQIGFKNISIDLIFGLPGQSLNGWKKNLEIAVELPVSHLSCYQLIIEPNTPLKTMIDQGKVILPPGSETDEMYELTIEFLEANGFHQYEVSNFAKNTFECQHNLVYWQYGPYLAFGPSAHGFIKNKRYKNFKNLNLYLDALSKDQLPIQEVEVIESKTRVNEKLMLAVRHSKGIQILDIWDDLLVSDQIKLKKNLDDFQKKGYLRWSFDQITGTKSGIKYGDSLAEELFIG